MNEIIYIGLMIICVGGMFLAYREEIVKVFPREIMDQRINKLKEDLSLWVVKRNRKIPDKELFKSSVILKNRSRLRRQTPLSADYIYENLMENSDALRPMYGQMLTLYRSGKDEEAFKIPATLIGTKAAKNFGIILSKLDKLNPAELTDQMDIFQENMTQRRMTWAMKRVQRNSLIITSLSTISVFAILINFVVVVDFMDSLSMLNSMFG